jgi:hypothetical protein
MGLEDMEWIHLAQYKYKWVAMSTVMNLLLAKNAENFMIV